VSDEPNPPPPATPAQVAELAEQVRVAVETVRARLEELTARIDALTAQLGPSAPPAPPVSDDAPRLLAVELAVTGATRADVDARLRERFALRSTTELLDAVFGVGSSPGSRLPWGGAR
jgi:hypothetical protein